MYLISLLQRRLSRSPGSSATSDVPTEPTTSGEMNRMSVRHQKQKSNARNEVKPENEGWYRTCHICKITIMEVKDLPRKRRYFCELLLDSELMNTTSTKLNNEYCFWGESYQYDRLKPIHNISVRLYKDLTTRQGATFYGSATIPVQDIQGSSACEKWFTVSSPDKVKQKLDKPISIRIQAHLMALTVLPYDYYSDFEKYLQDNCVTLCRRLEPVLKAKEKEEIAVSAVRILYQTGHDVSFLTSLIHQEVKEIVDMQLIFRSNSFGSKAVEAYIKLLGQDYLFTCLGEFLQSLIKAGDDCEVDPNRLQNQQSLAKNQRTLSLYTEVVWQKILKSGSEFPPEIRSLFSALKKEMVMTDKGEVVETLLSSCFFLRYICPAILSPSLFNLVGEYPTEPANRTLTLIAKSLQALANFSRFRGKESYMEFMNSFIERQWTNMKQFLHSISSTRPEDAKPFQRIKLDTAKELAVMQSLLQSGLTRIQPCDELRHLDQIIHGLVTVEKNPVIGPPPAVFGSVRPVSEYDNVSSESGGAASSDGKSMAGAMAGSSMKKKSAAGQNSHQTASPSASTGSGKTDRFSDYSDADSNLLIKRDSIRQLKYIDDTASQSSSSELSAVEQEPSPLFTRTTLTSSTSQATLHSSKSQDFDRNSAFSSSRESIIRYPVTEGARSNSIAAHYPLATSSPIPPQHHPLSRTHGSTPLATTGGSSSSPGSGNHRRPPLRPATASPATSVARRPSHRIYLANEAHSESQLDKLLTNGHYSSSASSSPVVKSVADLDYTRGHLPNRRHGSWYIDKQSRNSIKEESDEDVEAMKKRLQDIEVRLNESERRETEWRRKYEEVEPKLTEMLEVFGRLKNMEAKLLSEGKKKNEIIQKQQQKISSLEGINATLLSMKLNSTGQNHPIHNTGYQTESTNGPVIYRSNNRKNSLERDTYSESSDELVMDAASDPDHDQYDAK